MNKLLITFAAGFVIGILVAPAKGSDTRRKIRNKIDDLQDELDWALNREQHMVKNALSTITES